MDSRHSGFSVHNKAQIARDDEKGRVALAQYIIRNTFSLEKLTYNQEAGTVIYRSKMSQGKSKKNFQIYTAEEFVAAITQHIPEKSFQTCTELVEVWCVTMAGIQTSLADYEKNREISLQKINRLMKGTDALAGRLYKPLR